MNITQLYSLTAGAYISKPFIRSTFFPLPFNDKYIIYHAYSKPIKSFSFHDDVIAIIKPELDKKDIKIIQIGAKDDKSLRNVYNICGQTSINNIAYLISNCELVFSPDSFSSHLAGHYNKFLVNIISNNRKENVRPFFGDQNKQIHIVSYEGRKPNYSFDEQPRSIDKIKPETIARHILELLEIPYTYPYQTEHIGSFYFNPIIESANDCVIDISNLGINSLIMRMDFNFNEQVLAEQLKRNKCSIITDKPVNFALLQTFRAQLQDFIYILDENYSLDYAKKLYSLGINIILLCYKPEDSSFSANLKLDFCDYSVINFRNNNENVRENLLKLNKPLYYKTRKFTLSQGKIYPSKAAWLENKPVPNFEENICPIIDNIEFWPECDSFRILSKI